MWSYLIIHCIVGFILLVWVHFGSANGNCLEIGLDIVGKYCSLLKTFIKIHNLLDLMQNIKYLNISEINLIKYCQQIYVHLWYQSRLIKHKIIMIFVLNFKSQLKTLKLMIYCYFLISKKYFICFTFKKSIQN